MSAPKILYRFTWTWPNDPEREFHALVDHEGSMDLAAALEGAGATVHRAPAERSSRALSEAGTAPQTDDYAPDGGYHPDASDRAAMGRLARRAFTGGAGREDR